MWRRGGIRPNITWVGCLFTFCVFVEPDAFGLFCSLRTDIWIPCETVQFELDDTLKHFVFYLPDHRVNDYWWRVVWSAGVIGYHRGHWKLCSVSLLLNFYARCPESHPLLGNLGHNFTDRFQGLVAWRTTHIWLDYRRVLPAKDWLWGFF